MKKVLLTIAFSALVLVLAACGGDDSSNNDSGGETTGTASTVDLVASNWEFEQDTYTVPAGDVTVNLSNAEGYHGIEIDGADLSIDGEGSATVNLEAGEYTIKCNIPCGEGHETMEAKLIVE
ncbi:cytochrome C oxidase subunit II [Aquibacillus halophilus]|uniref:Cytochrome C oxidase subunit II n=1 Tax=Aquibacillus halophilus TaxID=930132 RepID=A0A6A8DAG7_9BACI|nr:cytochrome C oxidase subunit II [Aquibacillus halophilus]MRH42554.1 cytochrome C oxidase subunit II [Aquibacillus halophilus]